MLCKKILLFFSCILSTASLAEQNKQLDSFSFGLGVVYSESIYKGVSDNLIPIPLLSLKYKSFRYQGLNLSYNLYTHQSFGVSIGLNPQFFSGYEAADSSALKGMTKRRGGLEGQISATFSLRSIAFKADIGRDVLGRHNGLSGSFSVGSGIPLNIFLEKLPFTLVRLTLGGCYESHKFNDYFYGVQQREALFDRKKYKGKDSISPYARFFILVKPAERWGLQLIYTVERLASSVRNSPIVDSAGKQTVITGISYSFWEKEK